MPGNVSGAEPDQLRPTRTRDTPSTANRPDGIRPMVDYAMEYAQAGALVLPLHTPTPGGCSCKNPRCPSTGKHPRTLRGLDAATSDEYEIESWWRMWPEANIGIRPQPGQIVVDIDPRNGGSAQLRAMQATYGPLVPTLSARTGGNGWHLWYLHHGAHVAKLAAGVDVKGNSGYVVAPPSLHASGRRYSWYVQGSIVAPPEYLTGLLKPVRPVQRDVSGTMTDARMAALVKTVAEAQEGNRNNALHWAARRIAEVGADPNPIIDAAVSTGLDRAEVERTVASAFGGG